MKKIIILNRLWVLISLIGGGALLITIAFSCKKSVAAVQKGTTVEYTHTSKSIPALMAIQKGEFIVEDVKGDTVEFSVVASYKNGTTEKNSLSVNRKTGEGNGIFAFVRPGLNKGDQVYEGLSDVKVNDVLSKDYDGQKREVLVIEISRGSENLQIEIDKESGVILKFVANPSLVTTSERDSVNITPSEIVEFRVVSTNLW
ncbi:MAG: hypothetical protein DYG98_06740 [Haliscomenobacteraceae bacterium CHB4]|nr:hypothetical protein [Haliscomenobacteraceae bacterium CHB4]